MLLLIAVRTLLVLHAADFRVNNPTDFPIFRRPPAEHLVKLKDLQSNLAFQINREIKITPNNNTVAFENGAMQVHNGQCLFRSCPALNLGQTMYPVFPLGCEIRTKHTSPEPRFIAKGTRLLSTRRESSFLNVEVCFPEGPTHKCRSNESSEVPVALVTFYLDSENIEFIRCGAKRAESLDLGFLYNHFEHRIEVMGALIERIE